MVRSGCCCSCFRCGSDFTLRLCHSRFIWLVFSVYFSGTFLFSSRDIWGFLLVQNSLPLQKYINCYIINYHIRLNVPLHGYACINGGFVYTCQAKAIVLHNDESQTIPWETIQLYLCIFMFNPYLDRPHTGVMGGVSYMFTHGMINQISRPNKGYGKLPINYLAYSHNL